MLLPGGSISFSLTLFFSPKAELKSEKKSGHRLRNHEDDGPQKELKVPGIVDFEVIRKELKTLKPQTSGTYRFGRLSHHSFFSRHHPHPQRVTHIQGRAGVGQGLASDRGAVLKIGKGRPIPCFQAEAQRGWRLGQSHRAAWPLARTWPSQDLTWGAGYKGRPHIPYKMSLATKSPIL